MGAVRVEHEGDVAVLVVDNPPVNAGSAQVRRGLLQGLEDVAGAPDIRGVVVIGAGRSFVSGSDVREFGGPLAEPELPAVIAAVEACSVPVVAAIHGVALGGGFELVLGCDARIAVRGAELGLPEVTLGIMPGAGGTVRTPRLTGVPVALDLIGTGRRVKAERAAELGLVDEVVDGDLRSAAVACVRRLRGDKRRVRDMVVPAADPHAVDQETARLLRAGSARPHVRAAVEAVLRAATHPFDAALSAERAEFQRLRTSDEAAALRYLFFAERRAGALVGTASAEARPLTRAGVVGAGTMGTGIAVSLAAAGIDVLLTDADDAALARGMSAVPVACDGLVRRRLLDPEDAARAEQRITSATLDEFTEVDLVVEAVVEDMTVKAAVFRELDAIVRPGAILATNTSYLDVDELATSVGRPDDVVGLHFFNPADRSRLIEVVQGAVTGPDVLASALRLARRLDRVAVVSRVAEGFIGNRVFAAYRRQCEFMVEEGAWPEQVDAALEEAGMAMGPFAVADLSGLDIAWSMRRRLAATRDPRERYVEIPDLLCEAGRLGRKAGAGWYRYPPGARRGEPDPEVRDLVEKASSSKAITRRPFTAEEIRGRAFAAMVNEAVLLLDEGVARQATDVDVAMVNGYGFPRRLGGPLYRASRQDQAELRDELGQVADAVGFGHRSGDVAAVLRDL